MAHFYLSPQRDQDFLMPVSMKDWLLEGHLAYFIIDIVAALDTGALHTRHPNTGVGRPAYDPDMMLALMLYAYANGARSTRRIEASCRTDAAYRVICGCLVPDHSTIARFVADQEAAMEGLFVSGLRLCAVAGLVDLSVLSLDGTKMGSDAALDANHDIDWIRARIKELVAALVASEDAGAATQSPLIGLEAAGEVTSPRGRLARLRAAQGVIEAEDAATAAALVAKSQTAGAEAAAGRRVRGAKPKDPVAALARAKADHDAALAKAEARAARRAAAIAAAAQKGHGLGGRRPGPDNTVLETAAALGAATAAALVAAPAIRRTANVTDPESRIMMTKDGWLQGYNAQAVATVRQIVVATGVSQDANDLGQFVPMLGKLAGILAAADIADLIEMILADAGYWSDANAAAEGPDRLIATLKDYKQRRAARQAGTTTGEPPEGASLLEAMEHRLRTAEGAAVYAKRSISIEPVFGHHKENRGWRRFRRRGLKAARSEWAFMNLSHNMAKLFEHRCTQTAH